MKVKKFECMSKVQEAMAVWQVFKILTLKGLGVQKLVL